MQFQTLVPCNCTQCLGTENPYTYPLEKLHKRLKAGVYEVQCDNSYKDVDVRRLIDDVNLPRASEYRESQPQDTPLQRELEREKQKSLNINQIIKLSGQQRKKLLNALLDAFPTKFLLKQLLSFELDKKLESFAGGDNLQEVVFNVIETAEAEGWLEELVCSAKESNPKNALLIAITQEL